MKKSALLILLCFMGALVVKAQIMKSSDLEAYAKERYGSKWQEAALNIASSIVFDKNESITYQQVIDCGDRTKEQLYIQLNYWVTATFKDKQAITLNDKESGTIIISSTIDDIAQHTGTLNEYTVSITPIIRIDIKPGRIRVTYTVQSYDILNNSGAGWIGGLLRDDNVGRNSYGDAKRMKDDKTDRNLYDEQWEIAKHFPFVEKDNKKRTCAKALVMTHAYSNAVMDKIQEAATNGLVGNEDDDW